MIAPKSGGRGVDHIGSTSIKTTRRTDALSGRSGNGENEVTLQIMNF